MSIHNMQSFLSSQSKTYDSVTEKFMDFSFEKVSISLHSVTVCVYMNLKARHTGLKKCRNE